MKIITERKIIEKLTEKPDGGFEFNGSLDLRNTSITELPDNLSVGGSVFR